MKDITPEIVNTETQAVAIRQTGSLATAPDVGEMLKAVLQKGVKPEDVAVVREIVALYKDMRAEDAKVAFTRDFVKLAAEIPRVQAMKPVNDKSGNVKYKIAPFEDIDAQVRPICLKHGFTYDFEQGPETPARIVKVCNLRHVGGHTKSNAYSVRIGSGPPGATESQADGSAHSYAKRGALCDCLAIVISHQDDDPRNEGAPITAMQAEQLRRLVRDTGAEEARFLKYADAKTYEEISSTKFDMLVEALGKKKTTK